MPDAFGSLAPAAMPQSQPDQPSQSQLPQSLLGKIAAAIVGRPVNLPQWGDVGAAMPEAYGANAPIMDPLANMALGAVKTAMVPGQVYNSDQPITTGQMVGPATDLAGMVTLGAGAAPAEADALRMGIKAYHGSPYDFDAFDLSKIGTGEGAQAYGHGLYFAENPKVAQQYRDEPSAQHGMTIGGQPFEPGNYSLTQLAGNYRDNPTALGYALRSYIEKGKTNPYANAADAQKMFDALNAGTLNIGTPGKMYEVDINADPEHFLDWDKPLSEQPQGMQDAVRLAHEKQTGFMNVAPYKTGEDISKLFGGKPESADALRNAGIPGIKYLDQGSRAAGEGSRNYVVFNDKLINILRKYGLAGLPAAGVAAGAASDNRPYTGMLSQ